MVAIIANLVVRNASKGRPSDSVISTVESLDPARSAVVTDPPFTGHHLTGSNRRSWPAAPHNPMVRFRVLPNATAVAQVVNEIRKKGAEQPVEIMVVAGDWERWSGQGDGFGPETDLTADS